MRFSVAAIAAMAAGVQASYGYGNSSTPVYVTEVVTAYTTYCPTPTEITHGGQTYTVTTATTLTITNCPCTITKPVYSSTPAPVYPTSAAPVYTPPPYANGTTPAPPASTPVGTGSPTTTSAVATFTGAANKAMAASGAGLAGLFAAVAYIL